MKKNVLFLSLFTIIFALGLNAQDKTSDIKKLVELTGSEKMVENMIENMTPMLKQQASQQIKGDNAEEKLNEYMDFLKNETIELSNKMLNDKMVDIYDKNFTHEEIKHLIEFYESPTGKKILEKMPEITCDLMNAMTIDYMPEFQEKLTQKLIELKK